MGTAAAPMRTLYSRLSETGLPRKYVREVLLPDWWDDEAAESPAGLAEAMLTIARHGGVDYESLKDPNAPVRLATTSSVRYKRPDNIDEEELGLATALVLRAAHLAALAAPPPTTNLLGDPIAIREELLGAGAPWVSFEVLLDACWAAGIPVLHVSRFPKGAKKMHGMAVRLDGRAVIVISRQDSPAWLLFILAHELGHICLGHVAEGQTIVDQVVGDDESSDSEERDANAFAIALLCGVRGRTFMTTGRWPTADQLAAVAVRIGREHRVDPGHIALNVGHTQNMFALARAALAKIDPHTDGPALTRKRLVARLDWTALPEDSARFLARLCGVADDEGTDR